SDPGEYSDFWRTPSTGRLGHLASAFTPSGRDWHFWKLVSSHSSATVPDFRRVPHAASHLPADQTRMPALLEQTRVALTGRNSKEPDAILFPGSVSGKKKSTDPGNDLALVKSATFG